MTRAPRFAATGCIAALWVLMVSGCATFGRPTLTDYRSRPASTVVARFGEPNLIRRVSPGLLLYEWYARDLAYYSDLGGPVPGLQPKAGFFVRADGTVVGPACMLSAIYMTNVEQIVAILGPPTNLERGRFFDVYTWLPGQRPHERTAEPPRPPVEIRLALSVDENGFIRGWS